MLCSQMTTWMHLQSHLSDLRTSQNRSLIVLYAIRTTRAIYPMKLSSLEAHANKPSPRFFHSKASTSLNSHIHIVSLGKHIRSWYHTTCIYVSLDIFTSHHIVWQANIGSGTVRQKAANSIHVFPTRVEIDQRHHNDHITSPRVLLASEYVVHACRDCRQGHLRTIQTPSQRGKCLLLCCPVPC